MEGAWAIYIRAVSPPNQARNCDIINNHVSGAFDAAALAFSAYEGNVGWIHPTGVYTTAALFTVAGSFWVATAWAVRREWKLLASYDEKRK